MNQAISKYEQMLRFQNMAETTKRSYVRNLKDFLIYCRTIAPEEQQLIEYLDKLSMTSIETTTWNQKMYSVKKYWETILKRQFPAFITKKKVPKKQEYIPTETEILIAIRKTDFTEYLEFYQVLQRKSALLLMYYELLRRSELWRLRFTDVYPRAMMLHVRQGKGSKDRWVELSGITYIFLKLLRQHRPDSHKENPYILSTYSKLKYKHAYLCKKWINRLAQSVGESIGYIDWHPHLFRKAGATHDYMKTGDIIRISNKLGHNDIKTTMDYIRLNREHLVMTHYKNIRPAMMSDNWT